MIPNKDKLSRPSRERFFPVAVPTILRSIRELGFAHSEFKKRIDLFLENPNPRESMGTPVAAFYPREILISYSFPSDFEVLRAELLLLAAVREFRTIDASVSPSWNRAEVTSYRAYLIENNRLRITQRKRVATPAKYRSGAKFSNAFKPKKVVTDEHPFRDISID